MRVKSAMFYVDQLQTVAEDFVARIEEVTRDREGVAPDTFLPELLNYSQECIALVALGECCVQAGSRFRNRFI